MSEFEFNFEGNRELFAVLSEWATNAGVSCVVARDNYAWSDGATVSILLGELDPHLSHARLACWGYPVRVSMLDTVTMDPILTFDVIRGDEFSGYSYGVGEELLALKDIVGEYVSECAHLANIERERATR